MKSSNPDTYFNFNSVKTSNSPSNVNFSTLETTAEKQITSLIDLYSKNQDEPDFDCEFIRADFYNYDEESIIDAEQEEDLTDDYNDNEWDTSIYDPYQEAAYF